MTEIEEFKLYQAFATLKVADEPVVSIMFEIEAAAKEWVEQVMITLLLPFAENFAIDIDAIEEVESQYDRNLDFETKILRLEERVAQAERALAELTVHLAQRDPLFGAPEPPPSPGSES